MITDFTIINTITYISSTALVLIIITYYLVIITIINKGIQGGIASYIPHRLLGLYNHILFLNTFKIKCL